MAWQKIVISKFGGPEVLELVEESTVPTRAEARPKLAIVGAGFTGLTLAAALLRKRTALEITIFEERDTLLPLQQGSDSRWLHPQIYEWPDEGSGYDFTAHGAGQPM